jgi:hypothetical protein
MSNISIETAEYIIMHYSNLLSLLEKAALRHHRSKLKLEKAENDKVADLYYKKGWLSENPKVLNYLSNGYVSFVIGCAERILQEASNKVILNHCPNCQRLARTPFAKQCRHCHHNWH